MILEQTSTLVNFGLLWFTKMKKKMNLALQQASYMQLIQYCFTFICHIHSLLELNSSQCLAACHQGMISAHNCLLLPLKEDEMRQLKA